MNTKKKKNFICTECNKGFIDNAHLKEHQVKHTKEKLFICTICNKKFARSGSLRVHSKIHSGQTTEYVCPYDDCSRKYTSRSGFINHQKKHNEILNHIQSVVPSQSIPISESIPITTPINNSLPPIDNRKEVLECPITGCTKTFSNEDSLNFHTYRIHLGIDSSVCSKSRCIQLRKSYLKQQVQIHQLRERIKKLESLACLLSEQETQEFEREYQEQHKQQEFEREYQDQQITPIPIIPLYYLEEEKPYVCGVPDCSRRFSTYRLLQFHSKSHPDYSLDSILQQQLYIPDGPVYCPVLGCKNGPDQQPLPSYFILKRHYQNEHKLQYKQSFNQIQRLGNTTSDTNEILNSLIEDGALVIQNATILSDVSIDHSNVSIASKECSQVIQTNPNISKLSKMDDHLHSPPLVETLENPIDFIPPIGYTNPSSLWFIVIYNKQVYNVSLQVIGIPYITIH